MKRIGRYDIWFVVLKDGEEQRRELEHRTIYEDSEGRHFITWMGSRARVTRHTTPGTFIFHHLNQPNRIWNAEVSFTVTRKLCVRGVSYEAALERAARSARRRYGLKPDEAVEIRIVGLPTVD